jgi:hypothetical protein
MPYLQQPGGGVTNGIISQHVASSPYNFMQNGILYNGQTGEIISQGGSSPSNQMGPPPGPPTGGGVPGGGGAPGPQVGPPPPPGSITTPGGPGPGGLQGWPSPPPGGQWSPINMPPPPNYDQTGFGGQSTVGATAGAYDYEGLQGFADQAYDASRRYLDPQQDQMRRRHEQQLINMGIDPMSQAGQDRLAQMQRGINDQNNAATFSALGFGAGIQDQMFNQNFQNTQQAGDMLKALWDNQTGAYGIGTQGALGRGNLELGRQQQDWNEYGDQMGWMNQDRVFNEGNRRFDINTLMGMIPGINPPTGSSGSINPGNLGDEWGPWGDFFNNMRDYWG